MGFEEETCEDHGYEQVVYMSDGLITLEIYVDGTHVVRMKNPEALGLRHLSFEVQKIEEFGNKWGPEVKTDKRGKFLFIYDPDGLPIEIRERVPKTPKI